MNASISISVAALLVSLLSLLLSFISYRKSVEAKLSEKRIENLTMLIESKNILNQTVLELDSAIAFAKKHSDQATQLLQNEKEKLRKAEELLEEALFDDGKNNEQDKSIAEVEETSVLALELMARVNECKNKIDSIRKRFKF